MRRITNRNRRQLWPRLESGLYVPPMLSRLERGPLVNPGMIDRGMGHRRCPLPIECVYFFDDFDRGNDTDIGADWNELSGAWSIASNTLLGSGTGGVAEAVTTGGLPYTITVKTNAGDGAKARIIFDFTDTANYTYVQLELAAGPNDILSVVTRVSNVDTTIATVTLSLSAGVNWLRVCVTDDGVIVNTGADGITFFARLIASIAPTESSVGLGTGNSSNVSFDDFSFTVHEERSSTCNKCLACAACLNHRTPAKWQVVLAGLASPDADCPSLNGTWILTMRDSPAACFWITEPQDFLIQAPTCGDKTCLYLRVSDGLCASPDNYAIIVGILGCENSTTDCEVCGDFIHTQNEKYRCREISGFDVPRDPAATQCDISAATCTITAL